MYSATLSYDYPIVVSLLSHNYNAGFQIGAVAGLKAVHVVDRLPKTRSGKILRATIKKLADGVECEAPATIEDASVLDEIRTALKSHAPAQEAKK